VGLLPPVFGEDTMKIGDLVKWLPRLSTCDDCLGLIVGEELVYEGYDWFVVLWQNDQDGESILRVDPKHLEKIQ
tara:strand:- start:23 stop:244 length:222 start_codon:yes stop_codon:yes gene_type:complete